MARITVEDCLKNVENRFSLVLITAARTKQLMKGAPVLLDTPVDNKEIVTALREIAAGKIKYYERDPEERPPEVATEEVKRAVAARKEQAEAEAESSVLPLDPNDTTDELDDAELEKFRADFPDAFDR